MRCFQGSMAADDSISRTAIHELRVTPSTDCDVKDTMFDLRSKTTKEGEGHTEKDLPLLLRTRL